MSKIKITSLSNVPSWEELRRFTDIAVTAIQNIINGSISFTENIDCQIISVSFVAANKDVVLNHGLGRIPTGYIVTSASVAMSVYTGSVAGTSTQFYLRSSVIGNANILLF